ncbi:MAG: chromate transporter [Alphaproteobacteria bacterium]|nr:chromate transporter [Alphaproteobacteria bacterium]
MSGLPPLARLSVFLAAMSLISFGGVPPVLPDIRDYVVIANGWLTDRDFADVFALAQTVPGPNMIMMMGLIGWKLAGVPGALAGSTAIAVPACTTYYLGYRLWNRFHGFTWQSVARASLVPLTCGLIVAGGTVMAQTADKSWPAVAISVAAALLLLTTRLNPLWMLAAAGALGASGLV